MTGWPSNQPVEIDQLSEEEILKSRDQTIQSWLTAKAKLEEIKSLEMQLRKQLTEILFPTPKKGTQRFSLNNGYAIKLVYKLNHKLGDNEKINDEGVKVRVDDQVFELQSRMEKLGPQAELLADRLIKWSLDLSVSEYEKLDLGDPVQRQLRDMIDEILTITPAAPSLEFEEPKVK